MPEETRPRRLAILIDADNTSPRIAAGLFEEVAKFGEASVRRIYGDFSGQRLKSWVDILQKYAIDPFQQFAYTTGKNASDIALVIDAMDLLHSGRLDGFCQHRPHLASVVEPTISPDSLLEGSGFEPSVPRFRDGPFCLCGTSRSGRKDRLVLREGPAVRILFPPAGESGSRR
jgi:hypothetical protein